MGREGAGRWSVGGWRDAVLLSVGMFTAIRVPAPTRRVDRTMSGRAILLAPVAVVPLAALVAAVLWCGDRAALPPLAVGFVAVSGLALGSRAFHLDGLADTVDGLSVWGDREKRLAVLKSGDVGPAGAAALVVTLGLQAAAIAAVCQRPWAPVVVGVAVCLSRLAPAIGCTRGIAAARPTGLGAGHAQSIPWPITLLAWLIGTAVLVDVMPLAELPRWRAVTAVVPAVVAIGWLLRRSHQRFGGMVGDVLGASVEVCLTVLLLALS